MERKQLIECITNGEAIRYQDTDYLPVGYTLRHKDGKLQELKRERLTLIPCTAS